MRWVFVAGLTVALAGCVSAYRGPTDVAQSVSVTYGK